MKTLTLKISELLESKLKSFARKKGKNRSEIVRLALTHYFSSDDIEPGSFLDLSQDLIGSIEGSKDLSWNKKHLQGYGK
ncbi:MAG: ribbon-helix-helix domain-containing protein [bacterium]